MGIGLAGDQIEVGFLQLLGDWPAAADANLPELVDNPQLMKLREEMRLAETRLAGLKERYTAGNPAITAAAADISTGGASQALLRLNSRPRCSFFSAWCSSARAA